MCDMNSKGKLIAPNVQAEQARLLPYGKMGRITLSDSRCRNGPESQKKGKTRRRKNTHSSTQQHHITAPKLHLTSGQILNMVHDKLDLGKLR